MSRTLLFSRSGAPLALLLASLSCMAAARTETATPASGHEHHMAGMDTMPVTIPPGALYTKADVHFMQGMIAHHAQAIEMARMAASHGANPQLLMFTLKIDLSQRAEIDRMQWWLRDRGQAVPDSNAHHHMMMAGMLTPAQMKQLDAAKGREFDRLFLELMIQHHEGALAMVAELFAAPDAAKEAEVYSLAVDIDTDQRAEIERMREMLENL